MEASATEVAPGPAATTKNVQMELDEDGDDAVIDQATKVSDALDKKKGENNRTSKSFKKDGNQAKGKGKGKKIGKAAANVKVLKKPSAKSPTSAKSATVGTREYYASLPLQKKIQLRPDGCSKCRWSPGCTPSCYVK